jgi:hypothetical protein
MPQEIQQYLSDDARITLDVRVENETVWLTQAQMAVLFDTTPQNHSYPKRLFGKRIG